MKHLIASALGAVLLASMAGAQVGYPPAASPYVNLELTQQLSVLAGEYHAHRDPADVGPQSGALVGLHYEWRAGGPAHLIGDLSRVSSERRVVNPFKVGASRELGEQSRPLYMANVGLGLGLTGGKSWHHLVPEVAGGLGFVSDLHTQPDTGGYRFGTRFALNWGGGIQWIPGGRFELRADITNRLYTIGYPQAFYVAPTGGTAVIPPSQAKSFWINNPAYTLGLAWRF